MSTRGETPDFIFELPFMVDTADKVEVDFAQDGDVKLTKTIDDVVLEGQNIKLSLTEAETLSFIADDEMSAYADVQIKLGFGEKRVITDIAQIIINPILKDGEL